MSDIEQKALEMISAARKEHPTPDNYLIARTALCRAIEQHEATKQELADFQQKVSNVVELLVREYPLHFVVHNLSQFIIPKPDPLAQILGAFDGTLWEPEDVSRFRAALEARGLEIREKNDG